MCGISGIVDFAGSGISTDSIRIMNDLIVHRGPDDGGHYLWGNVALGHRRLAILDLSKDGRQPMTYQDDRLVIVYNGEIYNYLELRSELQILGYTFQSDTDTEVILAAYAEWGESCVERFNGMWAFALLDKTRKILFCSRDRFGIKPFYFAQTPEGLVFGSEIKQLLPFFARVTINPDVVADYIVAGYCDHRDKSFFRGVQKLPPSTNMLIRLDEGGFETRTYYKIALKPEVQEKHIEDALSCYGEKLSRSVMLRLRSDVRVGSCLSGGLDSSAVCAIASELYKNENGGRLNAIHAKSSSLDTDESAFAKTVAEAVPLSLSVIEPTFEEFVGHLDEVVYTQEEPFQSLSIFMQYFVMRRAKELGCKVMLDGQGGDETLLGYEKYFVAYFAGMWKEHGLFATLRAICDSLKNNTGMSLLWIFKRFFSSRFSNLRNRYNMLKARFVETDFMPDMEYLDSSARNNGDVFQLQSTEVYSTSLSALLRYEDRNSMRHSVEARLPFLDYQAVECALSMDMRHKIEGGWTKYVLRLFLNDQLPKNVVWRKDKLGFNAPEESWLRHYESEMLNAVQRSKILSKMTDLPTLTRRFPKLNHRMKWRLFNIACWERVYRVSC